MIGNSYEWFDTISIILFYYQLLKPTSKLKIPVISLTLHKKHINSVP